MARTGRPPTDTRVLQLRGTYRKDRHAPKAVSAPGEPITALPKAPKMFDGVARAVWQRAGAELLGRGVLTNGMLDTLALYCLAMARAIKHERELQEQGGATYVTPTGYERVRPGVAVAREAAADAREFAQTLGLTPAGSSTATAASAPQQNTDKDFLFG